MRCFCTQFCFVTVVILNMDRYNKRKLLPTQSPRYEGKLRKQLKNVSKSNSNLSTSLSAVGLSSVADISPHDRKTPYFPQNMATAEECKTSTCNVAHFYKDGVSKKPLTIPKLIAKYRHHLPMCIKLREGYSCPFMGGSISQGDVFNLHFVMHSRAVVMSDSNQKESHSIPLSSSVLFSPIFDPQKNPKQALAGYSFKTVGDLMSSNPMPHIVKATAAVTGPSLDSSVKKNEILVVKELVKVPGSKHNSLRVHSLRHGEKILPAKCVGKFSTKPANIQVTLSTIDEHSIPFPLKAKLVPSAEFEHLLPGVMVKEPVTLEHFTGETSVVATIPDENTDQDQHVHAVCSISSKLELLIDIVEISDDENTELYDTTKNLFENFEHHIASLQYIAEQSNSRAYQLQAVFYGLLQSEALMKGVHLFQPPYFTPTHQPEACKEQFQYKHPLPLPKMRPSITENNAVSPSDDYSHSESECSLDTHMYDTIVPKLELRRELSEHDIDTRPPAIPPSLHTVVRVRHYENSQLKADEAGTDDDYIAMLSVGETVEHRVTMLSKALKATNAQLAELANSVALLRIQNDELRQMLATSSSQSLSCTVPTLHNSQDSDQRAEKSGFSIYSIPKKPYRTNPYVNVPATMNEQDSSQAAEIKRQKPKTLSSSMTIASGEDVYDDVTNPVSKAGKSRTIGGRQSKRKPPIPVPRKVFKQRSLEVGILTRVRRGPLQLLT